MSKEILGSMPGIDLSVTPMIICRLIDLDQFPHHEICFTRRRSESALRRECRQILQVLVLTHVKCNM